MPFIANTPEALIGRSDSKNPATTCRGITSGGRPCRRPIITSNTGGGLSSRWKQGKLPAVDLRDESLYCWQHKDQARLSAQSSPGPRISNTPILEERTSLDTLADRLGILEAERRRTEKIHRVKPGQNRPLTTAESRPPAKPTRPKKKKELSCCFCFSIPLEEVPPAPRPRPRPVQPAANAVAVLPGKPSSHHLSTSNASGGRISPASPHHSNSSQTSRYINLIPPSTSPQSASILLAELAKPISNLDEPGYIYMFWLTPESKPSAPPAEVARSLLSPASAATRSPGGRRPSDVLADFADIPFLTSSPDLSSRSLSPASAARHKSNPKTILVKIGRANNVYRRLNEWTRQCGYNVTLIRYYPYISSNSTADVTATVVPRKMPHCHKVERLIHLELGGKGLKVPDRGKCPACGTAHREWFEIPATRQAVADVDEIIRRWVAWDEGL
jgi:hypothetical protein